MISPLQNLTPELIEALTASDYLSIKNLAGELHESTLSILDQFEKSPEDLNEAEQLRTTLCLKLDEAQAELSKDIADKRALKKSLEIAQGWASADRARIKSAKISLYVARKEGRA